MNDLARQFQHAVALHQAGRLNEAGAGYRRILEAQPGHSGALHYLGLLAHQKGQHDEAVTLLKRAVRASPGTAAFHFNFGTVLMALNRWQEAVDAFRQAAALEPKYFDAYCNLGVSLKKTGRTREAVEAYRLALGLREDAQCAYNMGLALEELRDYREAVEAYSRAIELNPALGAAHNGLGNALMMLEQPGEAADAFRKAIRCEGRNPEFHFNLGNASYQENMLNEAIAAYKTAVGIRPDYAEACNNLGVAFKKAGHLEEAIAQYRRAIEIRPDYTEAWNNLGNALETANRTDEAIAAYNSALERDPDNYEVTCNLAHALSTQGELDEAVSRYRHAQRLRPDTPDAYSAMAFLIRAEGDDETMRAMRTFLQREDLSTKQRADLHFALGKGYEELKDYERAFEEYDEGNRLKRETIDYDVESVRAFFEQIQTVFDSGFFDQRREWGLASNRPIFIVGMPRSGTTLTEQILAAHSRVSGGGELGYLEHTMFTMCPGLAHGGYPDGCRDLAREDFIRIAERYLERIELYSNDRTHVTNKLPNNYIYIGMIKILFTGARVVHCRRDPVDTCLSCYKQSFVGDINFSYNLRELGRYYQLYEELMAHWHRVLPGYVLDVRYEDLIADQEGQTRRILNFCELPWEDACMRFNEGNRAVKTASLTQVRRPLYSSSINRWKVYEKQLAPLLEALRES